MKIATTTTSRPRNPRRYYALHWPFGWAGWVTVYGFRSAADRDSACAGYRAPNHCPIARLEPALASHTSVSRAIRGTVLWGWRGPTSDVRDLVGGAKGPQL